MQQGSGRIALRASRILAAILVVALPGFGWGPEGHRTVAMIAERNLNANAREALKTLLTPHDTLAAIAVWADDIREEHPETAAWHYIDIPLAAPGLDMARDCAGGNCVVAKIKEYESTLKDKSAEPALRREAVEFLVHFVGDLHQPLHCEDNNDQGGNKVEVIFFGQPMNLHAVWDSGILRREKLYGAKLATELASQITPSDKAAWTRGTVEDWAVEGHTLAVKVAYSNLPHEAPPNLGEDYFAKALPVVEQQIEKAGIRLAFLLNQALQ